ncbi:hypothetical protein MT068_001370 [Salmonella enterica]|nr:hypothetical protein [Salmonella enterica]
MLQKRKLARVTDSTSDSKYFSVGAILAVGEYLDGSPEIKIQRNGGFIGSFNAEIIADKIVNQSIGFVAEFIAD